MRIPFLEGEPIPSPYPKGPSRDEKVLASLIKFKGLIKDSPAVKTRIFDLSREPVLKVDFKNYDPELGMVMKVTPDEFGSVDYLCLPQQDKSIMISIDKPEGRAALAHFYTAAQNMQGDEVELDTGKYIDGLMGVGYWNEYYRGIHGNVTGAYRRFIHPLAAKCVSEVASGMQNRVVMADLFGGDGQFLERLTPSLEDRGVDNYELHLVDGNAAAYRQAAKRFQRSDRVVVHEPTMLSASSDVTRAIPKNLDIVTALGGICAEVIHRNEALEVTNGVFDSLRPGGFFIVTGYSNSLLNSEDFGSAGFDVLNMTVPERIGTRKLPRQFYVLQKPTEN